MPRDKPGTQRKVFMLPNELVERIATYQAAMGLQSEVEAVRRLVDDALKFRDRWWMIADRIVSRLGLDPNDQDRLYDAAKEIVVGHPLVSAVTFQKASVTFTLLTGENVTVFAGGTVLAENADGQKLERF